MSTFEDPYKDLEKWAAERMPQRVSAEILDQQGHCLCTGEVWPSQPQKDLAQIQANFSTTKAYTADGLDSLIKDAVFLSVLQSKFQVEIERCSADSSSHQFHLVLTPLITTAAN